MIFSLPKVDKDGVLATHSTPQNNLGEYFCDNEENRLWVYLRANEALVKGEAVASRSSQQITTGLLAAPAGSNELNFGAAVNLNTTFVRVPNQPLFKEYLIVSETGGSQHGTVYSHTQQSLAVQWFTEEDLSLGTALAANADIDFATPWLVRSCPPATGDVVAFAQTAVAQGDYFWGLVTGVGVARANAAVAVHAPLRVMTTAGEVDDQDGTPEPCGYVLTAQSTADELIAIVASAPVRIGIPPFRGTQSEISYQYPTV